ncbi:MAG: HEPN domain-containing protein [bacterium]|nr:HEPN domain-containing protein [bacterium]
MARGGRTRPVTASQARRYLAKAEEYADAASSELDAQRGIAATSLAIHAAINAADAVCGVRLGERAASQDHDEVLVLLKTAGKDGAEVEKNLRRVLPLKTKAEYDPDDIPLSTASRAVDRAQRCVGVARRVVASLR